MRRTVRWPYLGLLGALLAAYMFLGRGIAHLALGPIYIGDVVLLIGLVVVAWREVRSSRPPATLTLALLLVFCVLGATRTLPYLPEYGLDALRDGVLWGYGVFGVIVYLLADRAVAQRALRAYGWVVPVFALWLPVSFFLFRLFSTGIDPHRPGEYVPLVFFKAGDMAVHAVGAIAFLVVAATMTWTLRSVALRTLILVPILWTAFVAGTANRGALLTFFLGVLAIAFLSRRVRQWVPVGAAACVVLVILMIQSLVPGVAASGQTAAASAGMPAGAPQQNQPASTAPVTLAVLTTEQSSPSPTPSPVIPPAGTEGVLANPSFEVDTTSEGGIFGWTVRSADVEISDRHAHAGRRFAVLGNPRDRYNATLRSQPFAITDGPGIYVSAWAKAVEGRPGLEIYVNWLDRSRELLDSTFVASLPTERHTEWKQCAGIVPIPANAVMAQVLFYESMGHATLGLDDVEVRMGDFLPKVPPPPEERRPATIQQMIANILSIFGSSEDGGLEGTKQFRLAWWGTIVDYTVFGDYFWTGKGFGINLADSDGFQSTADGSLRAPHNSHLTVLARMGVPGFVLWAALQAVFAIGLFRAVLKLRRRGDVPLAAVGAVTFIYWFAMMVDTSFDPYLEGPQGGIWFWCVFGLGMVVTRMASELWQQS